MRGKLEENERRESRYVRDVRGDEAVAGLLQGSGVCFITSCSLQRKSLTYSLTLCALLIGLGTSIVCKVINP